MMASSAAHQNQLQQQQVLKCPRCDSPNTKFCYYNNYNLSQPRHFCKACKRYWTRGGTLRNVPVGGGCRKKNKRIKTTTFNATHAAPTTSVVTLNHDPNPNLNHIPPSTPLNILQQTPKLYPRFDTHVSRNGLLYPHMSSSGLGFSSSNLVDSTVPNHPHNSISAVSSYPSSMYNDVSTSLEQQSRLFLGNDGEMEGAKSRMDWNFNFNRQNDNEQIKATETSFLWGEGGDQWLDPGSNMGSSVHSLI